MSFTDLNNSFISLLKKLEASENQVIDSETRDFIDHYYMIAYEFNRELSRYIIPKRQEEILSVQSNTLNIIELNNASTRLVEDSALLLANIKELIVDLNYPFKLFVMGTGNYGKSTVINSLLGTGEKHAKEASIPKTWKIDIFEHGVSGTNAIVKYKDGTEKKMSKKEVETLIENEEYDIEQQKREIDNHVKEMIKEKKITLAKSREYRTMLEEQKLNFSDVVEVRWEVADSQILQSFSIVDTPGLNQKNASGEVVNSAKDYYNKADGVLWLLDATAISGKKTNEMLKELNDTFKNTGTRRTNETMIAVLNKMDKLHENKDEVIKDAERIYGRYFTKIIPYSAKNAFTAMQTKDEILLETSGRTHLIKSVRDTFYKNSKRIQSEKKKEATIAYNKEFLYKIRAYSKELSKDLLELEKREHNIKDTMLNEAEILNKEFINGMNILKTEINNNIEGALEVLGTKPEETKKEYILKSIFQVNKIKLITNNFQEVAMENLSTKAQELRQDLLFTQYEELRDYIVKNDFEFNVVEDIKVDVPNVLMPSVGTSAIMTGAGAGLLFGPLGAVIGAGVAAYTASSMRNETIRDFKEELSKIIEGIVKDFENQIALLSNNLQRQVDADVLTSFVNLYSLKINAKTYGQSVQISNKVIELCKITIEEMTRDFEKQNTVWKLIYSKGAHNEN